MQYILTPSLKKIILGGEVMKQKQVFPIINKYLEKLLNGHVPLPKLTRKLGDNAGIKGALVLAQQAVQEE
jgi:fructokinase